MGSPPTTDRLYTAAQDAYVAWCTSQGVMSAAGLAERKVIARYLQDCVETRGSASTRVQLAAIGRMIRGMGYTLDTRSDEIQDVMRLCSPPAERETLRQEVRRLRAAMIACLRVDDAKQVHAELRRALRRGQ